MHSNLNHLTKEEINILMARYYGGEPVKTLIEEYQLSVRPAELFKLFPIEICENDLCEYCGINLIRFPVSKSRKFDDESNVCCPQCGHKPYIKYRRCYCDKCLEKTQKQEEEKIVKNQLSAINKKNNIKMMYCQNMPLINFDNLSFIEKVYLGTLCRCLAKEDMSTFKPYNELSGVLAPSQEMCNQIYDLLYKRGIISISQDSLVSAFSFDDNDKPNGFNKFHITYRLNLQITTSKNDIFNSILNPTYYSIQNVEDAFTLWKEIAVAECIEYLDYELASIGISFNAGDKTYNAINQFLCDYSVSQIYAAIYSAINNVARFCLERNYPKTYVANNIMRNCERYFVKSKQNGWTVPKYNRLYKLPQSELSFFFFNNVIGIGRLGFDLPPSKDILKSQFNDSERKEISI